MPRLTLADAKASRIPEVCNVSPTDARFVAYINEATQRLINRGHWHGSMARYNIAATSGVITLPKQIASIEKVSIEYLPVPVHDFWYEFLGNGFGVSDDADVWTGTEHAKLRGYFPSTYDIEGDDKQLRFVCDQATDVGKEVLALGWDDDDNWIHSLQGGLMRDGEVIALAQSPGTLSTNNFGQLTGLQLPDDLDGQVWLYEYDTVGLVNRLIGTYQHYDTRPNFARYYFPSIRAGTDASGNALTTLVQILAKLDYVPVSLDNDFLLISNLPALKEMCSAIKDAENEPDSVKRRGILQAGLLMAMDELNAEADHYLGSGRRIGLDVQGATIGENEPVMNLQ